MEMIKKQIRKAKSLASNRIDSRKLLRGDHIYVYRGAAVYSHHGIFIGGDETKYVIHYIQTGEKDMKPNQQKPCPDCGCWSGMDGGVVRSCLDCFVREDKTLGGRSVYLYEYGVNNAHRMIKRPGTCTTHPATKTPEKVLEVAEDLHKVNSFGEYDLIENNCEHFATFCKTGKKISTQAKAAIETAKTFDFIGKTCKFSSSSG